MARNIGKLKVVHRKYAYGCPIIKFEKKCFDWVCAGHSVTDVHDGYEVSGSSVKRKHHLVKYVYFRRPYDYKKNFLFGLTELLSNIVSFFRVLAFNLIVPVAIIGVVLSFVMTDDPDFIGNFWGAFAGVYGGLTVLSLVLALLGVLWRKLFRLTEKTDEIQEANGYMKWSEYDDDNSTDYDYA
ncbi:MAG: hypothetical protein NC033_03895 [Clostridiales bacterium]|nr:hypothetical protein [Clostridiales bacterium]